jgi:2-polyprenyl-6-methoxyphenol hydroxylase-like FAD-dependent oxidoreductase
MSNTRLRVLIVGAGTGGLCLAQGLKKDGVAVQVFERDRTPTSQLQGYRLSINETGSRTLRDCLPEAVFEKLTESAAQPSEAVTFFDHRLNRLLAINLPHHDRRDIEAERPVNRKTLRQILLEGLDDIVQFDKKFVAFDPASRGTAEAHFEDGSTAVGDVIVGADGASSHVRSLLLPEAKREDLGIVGIAGKLALTDQVRTLVPTAILRGPTLILGPRGSFMFCSSVQYDDLATPDGAPKGKVLAGDRENYVMWGVSARREKFSLPVDGEAPGGPQLKLAVEELVSDWHPTLRQLVEMTAAGEISKFLVKTSVPVPPWKTRNVTLLGDALHNMPPFRGIGANAALWDAAALRKALAAVDRGEKKLLPALAAYERAMIDHGFNAVRATLKNTARFHAEGWIERTLTKSVFRVAGLVPWLRNALVGGG